MRDMQKKWGCVNLQNPYQQCNKSPYSLRLSKIWFFLSIFSITILALGSSSTVYAGDQIFKYYNETLKRNGVERVKGKGELGYRHNSGVEWAINKYCLSDLARNDGDGVYIDSRMTSWGRNGYLRNEKKSTGKTSAQRLCGEHSFRLRGDETEVRISANVCVDHGLFVRDTCSYQSIRFAISR